MMKKFLAMLMIGAFMATCLVGCEKGTGGAGDKPTVSKQGQKRGRPGGPKSRKTRKDRKKAAGSATE